LTTPARYFHTLRHLRPIQIAARAWRRVHRPRADLRPAPSRREPGAPYQRPLERPPALVAADTFHLLNVERRCAAAADWHPPDVTQLWRYHLHYFDDLNAAHSAARADWHRSLLARWVEENPPGRGDGWDPYPLSRRLVNWVKWTARGNALPAACHASLAVQARWLCNCLEYHLLGNHLLANAKALVYAGLYFEGIEAERWYRRGMDILAQQFPEQVLADGGHFELSVMYHALALEDLLDLINLLHAQQRRVPADWDDLSARMRRWLLVMSHPDGDIAFFNDCAFGVAGNVAAIEAYALRLGLGAPPAHDAPLLVLADSGYVCARSEAAQLICDCAEVGPAYLPAHAHADTLSFELSLAGRRVLVNSGVSEYGTGPERIRQRGTAAHNTVVVDGQDSSEVWGGFRVARRAHARLSRATQDARATVEASHDGYVRLTGHNRHTRRWTLGAGSLQLEDRVSGAFTSAEARFHLHPDVTAQVGAGGVVSLQTHGIPIATLEFQGASAVSAARSSWHPRFGISLGSTVISARFAQSTLASNLSWPAAR
jgi:uncharacterized heparinase superfamily protein